MADTSARVDTRASGSGLHGDDSRGSYANGLSSQCEYYKNKNQCGTWGKGCKKTCGLCSSNSEAGPSSDAATSKGSCTPKPGKKPWKAHCDKATSQAACTGTGTAAAPYCAWAPSVTRQPSTPSVARQSAGTSTRQQAMSKLAKIASSKELRTRQQVLMELQGLVSKRLGEQHKSTSEQIDSEILQGLGQTQMNPHL